MLVCCLPQGEGKKNRAASLARGLSNSGSWHNSSHNFCGNGNYSSGLITIKEAHDIEARLNEVEKLLKTIINMPWKYSRSEVVLTFFERSPLDQVLKNDNVHKIQPSFQSPVKISEIMRSNGFCLANTETIVIDHSIPNGKEKHLDVDSAEHLFESVSDFTSELEDSDDPAAYVTNLTYYHLVPFETDILD
ncbi:PREDICTED: PX domain-containing protein 1 isoform X2 [Sturnus vulgaris]|uniref:PX domain-containing protein 1 isoform X2 n=1 Tax=Sturnus vulgaris TaxID=9172 RepID=UPI00071A5A25|nr:PREDICTED: PX domain-containing protein 1 isoform X2 [Sturnus vulgaris]